MALRAALRRLLGRAGDGGDAIRVRVLLKGRTGAGWYDCDERLTLPRGATLATLIEVASQRGIRLREALAESPHLKHTLMLNGERCPVDDNAGRALADGDEIYLLAPFAGG
ncbi:MAG: MoaD/ThiS family protein [Deltaproteobacteria bacterium]|nr:MoaD/ThiS family protein [Deltaproteobacteria bacterium]